MVALELGYRRRPDIRLLTEDDLQPLTANADRLETMLQVCRSLKRGHGLFLFADKRTLDSDDDLFSLPLSTAYADETQCPYC